MMRIGIIAEGSYPFIRGGVSSWIHMLASNLTELTFEIISIMPSEFNPTQPCQYRLPPNVRNVSVYRLGHTGEQPTGKTSLTSREEQLILDWMSWGCLDTEALELLADSERLGPGERFFQSRSFWRIVQESYEKEKQKGSFIQYFWMWRSMFTPLLALLQQDFPRVDLVHSVSTGFAGIIGASMKQTQQIPFILTEHGIYSREREEEILQSSGIPAIYKKRWIHFFHHLSRQTYTAADDIITLFQRNSQYQRSLGAPAEKCEVIPNGVDYPRLEHIQRTKTADDMLRIGAIVRVVPIKDIKTMIYAANILQENQIPFELTILGPIDEDPEYCGECVQLIESLGLQQTVRMLGQVNVADYLPRFDVCLLSSISEGQPLAVLEGMAAGLPWIVTDVGSCAELMEGAEGDPFGRAGFVVSPVDPEAIANRCRWYYMHRDQGVQHGENGRKRVQASYQLHSMIDQYHCLYTERGNRNGRDRV